MFSRVLRTRTQRIAIGVTALGLVGAGAGSGYYYYHHRRRMLVDSSPVNTDTDSQLDIPPPSSSSDPSTSPLPDGQPSSTPQSDTADFVLPASPPASRVMSHYFDVLRQDESSMIIDDPTVGFSRSDSCIYLAQPGYSEGLNYWMRFPYDRTCSFFMILEGYNGSRAAQFLRSYLLDAIAESLGDLYAKYAPFQPQHADVDTEKLSIPMGYPPPDAIESAIKKTFVSLDDDLVQKPLVPFFEYPSKNGAVKMLEQSRSGSSALLAFYEAETKTLRVALSGKTRAVLGRRVGRRKKGEEVYECVQVTDVQDLSNENERKRLQEAHSDEDLDLVFRRSSAQSMRSTRSFGDAAMKWSQDVQKRIHAEYLGDPPHPHARTPPYVTAEPIVRTVLIKEGDFLVLATSPFWRSLTEEETVGLVGWWINERHPRYGMPRTGLGTASYSRYGKSQTWNKYSFSDDDWAQGRTRRREDLPMEKPIPREDEEARWKKWSNTEKKFVNVDPNAATHLARNALGGADRDLTEALLNMGLPFAQNMRGDIGVSVIFFNDIPPDNYEAS